MILDEIRKLSFNHTSMESIDSKGIAKVCYEPVVKLSDIEKILGEMKCNNCKHHDKCMNCIYFLTDEAKDSYRLTFCSQFERKQ